MVPLTLSLLTRYGRTQSQLNIWSWVVLTAVHMGYHIAMYPSVCRLLCCFDGWWSLWVWAGTCTLVLGITSERIFYSSIRESHHIQYLQILKLRIQRNSSAKIFKEFLDKRENYPMIFLESIDSYLFKLSVWDSSDPFYWKYLAGCEVVRSSGSYVRKKSLRRVITLMNSRCIEASSQGAGNESAKKSIESWDATWAVCHMWLCRHPH